jgi:hypothetical protein
VHIVKSDNSGFDEMDDDALPTVPLTIDEWLNRELPPPDRLLGEWLTTTSRVYISADTGLGKTSLTMAIAMHCAACANFLRWTAHRPARVLFIDGEMSRRLLKKRIAEAVKRIGAKPPSLLFFSREDVEDFPPLNTPEGALWLLHFADSIGGGVDLIIFDNIMALLEGDQKDEVSWNAILPLVSELTKRSIGQIWIDHTGHDATRGYGSKTKQWRMDTVIHLTAVEKADVDIAFTLEFRKARERTPETRYDFEDLTVALVDDQWLENGGIQKKGKPSGKEELMLEKLDALLVGSNVVTHEGHRAIHVDAWLTACLDENIVPNANVFRSYRSRLQDKRLIKTFRVLTWRT